MKDMYPFTGIMLTHERHDYLARAFLYYSDAAFNINVFDSSENPYGSPIPSNIQYNHCPGENGVIRIDKAFNSVSTDYWGFISDDDFLSKIGISNGIDFLNTHNDYASVQGKNVSYMSKDGVFAFMMQNAFACLNNVSSDDPLIRMEQTFYPYKYQTYGVYRLEVVTILQDLDMQQMPDDIFWEFVIAACGGIVGKQKTMSYVGMLKEFNGWNYTPMNSLLERDDQGPRVQYMYNFIARKMSQYHSEISFKEALEKIKYSIEDLYSCKYTHTMSMLRRSGYKNPEMHFLEDVINKDVVLRKFVEAADELRDNTRPIFDCVSFNEFMQMIELIFEKPCGLVFERPVFK